MNEIPVAVFFLTLFAYVMGVICGWCLCRLLAKPREVVIASPRGARGRFVKREAKFREPMYPVSE